MNKYLPSIITAIVLIATITLGAMSASGQYTAELRAYDYPNRTYDVHITPLPERVVLAFAGATAPDVRFTGAENIKTYRWNRYDGQPAFYNRTGDEQVYLEATVYEIEKPQYSHIASIDIESPGVLAYPLIDGSDEGTKWAWFTDDEFIPAWDAELRALIDEVSDALAAAVSQIESLEIERDAAVTERDAAVDALAPVLAERDAALAVLAPVEAERDAAVSALATTEAELDAAKDALRTLLDSLPPGLRNR